MTGAELIVVERKNQVAKGFRAAHDDQQDAAELADAALCYLEHYRNGYKATPLDWPWENHWWKPGDDIRNLVKAGALIAAEIDRLQRVKGT